MAGEPKITERSGKLLFSITTAPAPIVTRAVFGVGAEVRYYLVPRYFFVADARWEEGGEDGAFAGGVGFGIHLGR